MNQFRDWEDKSEGIFRIGSPNTMSATSSPHNIDLILKVKLFLNEFAGTEEESVIVNSSLSTRKSQDSEVRRLKSYINQIEDMNRKLVSDWHLANEELAAVKRSLGESKQSNNNLKSVVAELRARIAAADRNGIHGIE